VEYDKTDGAMTLW